MNRFHRHMTWVETVRRSSLAKQVIAVMLGKNKGTPLLCVIEASITLLFQLTKNVIKPVDLSTNMSKCTMNAET